jgi:hypothetical protein
VFTTRYALSPYIKQIHFVFKGLIWKALTFALVKTELCVAKGAWCRQFGTWYRYYCQTPISPCTLRVIQNFYTHSQNCEKRQLFASCLSARPSALNHSSPTGRVYMKFEIWLIFRKYEVKIQFWLKYDKNNGYFTWRPVYVYDNTELGSSQKEKHLRKIVEKIKSHILYSVPFPKIVPFVR